MVRNLFVASILLMLSACSTVTILPEGNVKLSSKPTYEKSHPFFIGGLIGEYRVNVLEVCNNQDPIQLQTQETGTNILWSLFSFGIYTPRTAKIWCPQESNNEV